MIKKGNKMKVILSLMLVMLFVSCKKEETDEWVRNDTVIVDSIIDTLSSDTTIINHEVIVDR